MYKFFTVFICCWVAFALTACDDDGKKTANNDNTNNLNNVVQCDPACEGWEECVDGACEVMEGACSETADCPSPAQTCIVDQHICQVLCDPGCPLFATCEDVEGVATCVTAHFVQWRHREVTIVDPVVNGTSLNLPVDGVAYATMGGSQAITSYGRDLDDPGVAYLWHVNLHTGEHTKKTLTGVLPPADMNFCGGEDWCQFLGFEFVDTRGYWLVTGPRAESLLRIDASTYETTLVATSGDRPGDSSISYTHVFDSVARKLYVFGHLAPAGFSSTLYTLDLVTGVWTATALEVPQTYDNCLVVDTDNGLLSSFGGRVTFDGGQTSAPTDAYYVIDPIDGSVTPGTMPEEIGARQALSCAWTNNFAYPGDGGIYLFGGAVLNDHYNEALNVYYNDTWYFEPAANQWTRVLAQTDPGDLEPADEYGYQAFVGDPEQPNFGRHRGVMSEAGSFCGFLVIGEVPIFTHAQAYTLGVDALCMGK